MNNNNPPVKLTRIPSLKTVEDFRAHVASLGIELPCEDAIVPGSASPLAQPIGDVLINGKRIGNRWAIHPMEGWDGTTTGGVTEEVRRRWQRFGESGAKLIFGGEAMAVRPDGRANPNQIIIVEENKAGLASLRETLVKAHQERYGAVDDPVIGFQLTHSGRFCKPTDKKRMEPRVAFRHPILDRKFNVTSDDQMFTDAEIEELIQCYIRAAKIAWDVGADFVDIKHCHGYLLHEFLGAHTRPGKFGGSFENRTRILREIISGIRASGNKIELGVRLSAFDFVPFKPAVVVQASRLSDSADNGGVETHGRDGRATTQPGKLGPGIPEDFSHCLPYRYGFGVNASNPIEPDLSEAIQFVQLCGELGVKIVNLSAGSPYYNPHIQRPAAYPPSDGYQPPEDPLVGVARQINAVRQIKAHVAKHQTPNTKHHMPILVGTAYSYLQEYLPHVAQYVIRNGWTDMIGIGRMVLSYPEILADAVAKGSLTTKSICRTFSDCTTAPRNGMISGCYPLDKYYSAKPEFQQLKEVKKNVGG
ncbi:MAG: NADH:flavin oxidoreductase [Verrucomicrobia bacterium]|nr:NADH:flavin oxidoreductase [Verrucomicrobiota bacterium]